MEDAPAAMTAGARFAGVLIGLACLAGATGSARARALDPFRRAGPEKAATLDPFRISQATAAPGASEDPPLPSAPGSAAAPPVAASPVASTAPPAPPPPQRCQKDDDCPENSICQANVCQPIRTRTNIAYLYYREGSFREILLLYWAKKGTDGFTVLAPFYWHYWSPSSETRVIAPFYWRFKDRAHQSSLTVIWPILPVSWTRGPGTRSFAVWPLFYASNTLGWAVPLLGSFAVHDPATKKSTGAFVFLYWWRRGPDSAFDLGFPVFFSTRTTSHAFTFALPLNIYWRNDDDANTLAIPFFYANSHRTGSSFYTWLGYHDRDGAAHSGSLLWLYWFGGEDRARSRYDILFPVFWRFSQKGAGGAPISNTTVVPPYVHLQRQQETFDTLIPLWWSGRDRAAGAAFKLAIPFFYWRSGDHDKTSLFVTLLGGFSRDDRTSTHSWFVLPFFFSRRDPDHELEVITPLYIRHLSVAAQATTRLSGLIFYQRREPAGSTTALFPIFWRFQDAATGATGTVLLPLYAHRVGPRDTTTFVLPFYWRHFTGGGWSAGLLPIAFLGTNAGREHAVVFPLYWHFADAGRSNTVAFPLFYWHRDRHGYDSAWLPLVFVGRHDGERYAIQFPLFFHFVSERDRSSTTVTPLGYTHRDRDGWSLGIGPIVPLFFVRSGRERSHVALFPLFWHFDDRTTDQTTTVVALYWHRRLGGETTDALFPLFHYRRGTRPGGHDETSFTLFPVLHYRRDADTNIFVTLLGGVVRTPRGAGGFVGPFVWVKNQDFSARFIPFLYADVTRRATGERTRQFGPWFQIDAPGERARVLFPLFGHYADAKEQDTWVLPSYFRLRRNDGDRIDALLPLYWRSSFGNRVTTVVGPYYDRTTPTVHDAGVVPLYFYARNPDRTLTVIPPLLFVYTHAAAADRTWLWCGLLFHSRERDRSTTALFPIFWSKRVGSRRTDILFPVFWHLSDTDANSSWTLAGPFFASTAAQRRTRGILPIAWYMRDPESGGSANALLPLFYQSRGKDSFSLYTPFAGYRRAGPTSFSYVVPLWFHSADQVGEATTTVIPGLLYVSRQEPEFGLTTFLGLFWRQHDIASSTTLGLPLYYDFHDYHLSRTTVLFPLFVRFARDADQSSTLLAPLLYRHTAPSESTTIGFPLVWDFKSGDRRTTVVFPFYAHWRRPGYTGTYVFPTYYYREGIQADGTPDGTYRRFVLPFYDSGIKRPGDFQWEIFGGLVGHERIGRHRYLRLLYMTFETGPAPRAQTAWYSQPARPSRRAAPRGLNVAGF